MMHKAWCNVEEVPCCFPRSSIKFQGHTGWKIDDLDQIWARLLGRSQLSNPSDLPCFISHSRRLTQLLLLKFWFKQWSGRMLYTTALKHLQKYQIYPISQAARWGYPDLFDVALRWRHNERDCVSNHQPRHCLLNRLFGRRSKKTPKLLVTGLCAGNSPGTGEFPAQMASNGENVSIWWRHHVFFSLILQLKALHKQNLPGELS